MPGTDVYEYQVEKDVPYLMRVNLASGVSATNYSLAMNLDQANQTRNIGTLSDIAPSSDYLFKDFVGADKGDAEDRYEFQVAESGLVNFALRKPDGDAAANMLWANMQLKDGDGNFVTFLNPGKDSNENKAAAILQAGKTYYLTVTPNPGQKTNYNLAIDPVKPDPKVVSGSYYPELSVLTKSDWNQQSQDNLFFDGNLRNGESRTEVKQIFSDLYGDIFNAYIPMTAGYFDPTNYSGTHYGIDFNANQGTQVRAVVGGTIVNVQPEEYQGRKNYFVGVKGDDGKLWIYGHLDGQYISNGKRVEAGTAIGQIMKPGYYPSVERYIGSPLGSS